MCLHEQNSSAALRDLVRYAIIADNCEDVDEDVNTKIEPKFSGACFYSVATGMPIATGMPKLRGGAGVEASIVEDIAAGGTIANAR